MLAGTELSTRHAEVLSTTLPRLTSPLHNRSTSAGQGLVPHRPLHNSSSRSDTRRSWPRPQLSDHHRRRPNAALCDIHSDRLCSLDTGLCMEPHEFGKVTKGADLPTSFVWFAPLYHPIPPVSTDPCWRMRDSHAFLTGQWQAGREAHPSILICGPYQCYRLHSAAAAAYPRMERGSLISPWCIIHPATRKEGGLLAIGEW